MARCARHSSTNTAASASRSSASMPGTSRPAENIPGWPVMTIARGSRGAFDGRDQLAQQLAIQRIDRRAREPHDSRMRS